MEQSSCREGRQLKRDDPRIDPGFLFFLLGQQQSVKCLLAHLERLSVVGMIYVLLESDLLKGNYCVEGRLEWKLFLKNACFLLIFLFTMFLYIYLLTRTRLRRTNQRKVTPRGWKEEAIVSSVRGCLKVKGIARSLKKNNLEWKF